MIKRTLYFGNPAYLCRKEKQLIIKIPSHKDEELSENPNKKYVNRGNTDSIPIEDIGTIILDHQQITISQGLITALIENNTAIIACDFSHMPIGLFLPLESNLIQSERFKTQIGASEPLKKQLWQQTISAKIYNQAGVLRNKVKACDNMKRWAKKVRSGDPDNLEGRAAAYYWKTIFPKEIEFNRDREGLPPNNLLNYGYAILRAIMARSLVSTGLIPTLGIHHHNKYNAFCLADDIMEPYRPYVDGLVVTFVEDGEDFTELTPSIKKQLLEIPSLDVFIDGEKSPLMIATQKTSSSLFKCFDGKLRKVIYPTMFNN